jgi:oligosaccharide repeat unit polymerase
MKKIVNLINIYLYTIPFLVVCVLDWGAVSLLPLTICAMFYVGYYMAGMVKTQTTTRDIVPHRYVVTPSVLFVPLVIYFVVRIFDVRNVVGNLIDGRFVENAVEGAALRYEGYDFSSWADKIATSSCIAYAAALGMMKDRKLYYYIILVFMFFVESSGLARSSVLLATTAFFVEYIIKESKSLSSRSYFRLHYLMLIAMGILLSIFTFSAYYRVSGDDDAVNIVFLEKLPQYTIAAHDDFSRWMTTYHNEDWSFGYYTFAWMYKIFSGEFNTGVQGTYDLIITPFGESNIYTYIRGLITDFGVVSAYSFFFYIGFSVRRYDDHRMGWWSYFFLRLFLWMYIFFVISPYYFVVSTVGFMFPFFLCLLREYHLASREK